MNDSSSEKIVLPEEQFRVELKALIERKIEEDGLTKEHDELTEPLVNFHFVQAIVAHCRSTKSRLEEDKDELEKLRSQRKITLIQEEEYGKILKYIEDLENQIRQYSEQIDIYADQLERAIKDIALENKSVEDAFYIFSENINIEANKLLETIYRG